MSAHVNGRHPNEGCDCLNRNVYPIEILRRTAMKEVENWGKGVQSRVMRIEDYIKALALAMEESFKMNDMIGSDNEIIRFVMNGARDGGLFPHTVKGIIDSEAEKDGQ